ncbi:hypothetical protein KIH74_06850 [Kineosporia sp. J2-2]|uniref:Helix-turn-helix protein n=1 Tax=Kineosporia corallincola TaxID=2835133 RepID=A0ABS5TCR5_9ACTN|nr:hypothetical protein [Kineosporia corallincola]MBT0768638.1 hypothetical protein [Kineosporia corallincola]
MSSSSGRPPKPVERTAGPVAQFAADLRDLCDRRAAAEGKKLDLRELERRTAAVGRRRSRGTLSDALRGERLPTWTTTQALVEALDGDLVVWQRRHQSILGPAGHTQVQDDQEDTHPPGEPLAAGAAVEPDHPAVPTRRSWLLPASIALAGLALAGAAGFWAYAGRAERTPSITVQNMVAAGATGLSEDATPTYLSTRPVARCGSLGCKIDGTEMWSGIVLAAVCQMRGQFVTNADEGSSGIQDNPGAARSVRWYGVQRTDGSVGLISEVYIRPQDRGGLGLADCSQVMNRIATVAPATPG